MISGFLPNPCARQGMLYRPYLNKTRIVETSDIDQGSLPFELIQLLYVSKDKKHIHDESKR
jgi:hypothetical protein